MRYGVFMKMNDRMTFPWLKAGILSITTAKKNRGMRRRILSLILGVCRKDGFYTDLKEHLAASYSERIEVHEKHISFILRKINEYDTQGVKSMADRHIPFILGRINAYDHKEKVREDNHSEKSIFCLICRCCGLNAQE